MKINLNKEELLLFINNNLQVENYNLKIELLKLNTNELLRDILRKNNVDSSRLTNVNLNEGFLEYNENN